jgi:HK97 family phage major capsid protein
VVADLGAAANALDVANVPDDKRAWFMHPRSRNYLYDLLNSLGVYVFRDELNKGTLRNYPVYLTTQLPTNLYDASGSNTDCSLVILAEMTEAMLFDAMTLELAVSREGSYYDANAVLQSAFQNDETLIRAIAEHDFLMRHDASVAVIQNVRWANSGSL